MPKIFELKSIEDASLIRKFSVLFSLMSLLPFAVLSAAFFIFISRGEIKINPDLFFWSVFLIGVFAFIGFIGMRKTFVDLIKVSQNTKEILTGDFSKRINIKTDGNNEVAQLARAFNEVVEQLESNVKQLEKSKNTLMEVLFKFGRGISSTESVDNFLDLILETTVNALDANSGLLLTIDKDKNQLVIKSSYGLDASYSQNKRIPIEEEVMGWVVKKEKPLLVPRLHRISSAENTSTAFEPPLICAPLIYQNKVIGTISVSGKKQGNNFEEDELVILSNLASQIALAIENARLNADNQKTYLETITALALAVEARDVYSRGHSDRVGEYAIKIAQKLGLSEQKIKAIKEAAQLHDVGKIGISDEILRKPDVLNDVERNIMEHHPIIGEGIIIPLHGFSHLRDAIRHHHEWINGEGYPDHLKGDQISLEAKILAVADAFDAMTTDRPYRKGMDLDEAKQGLLMDKDIRYDGKAVDALINCL